MRPTLVLSVVAFILPALGAPTLIPITKRAGPSKTGSYIIKLKDGSPKAPFLSTLSKKFSESGSQSSITYDYTKNFPAVAVQLGSSQLLPFIQAMSGVEYIEEDGIMSIYYEPGLEGLPPAIKRAENVATSALSKRATGGQGNGVNVYGIDTGVYIEHLCFGGRATWGVTYGGYANKDGNGHGTHTAGIAVCQGYGVATLANMIAVKVLSDDGTGSVSDIVQGIQWAVQDCKSRGKPCVANMSLGGLVSKVLDDAVRAAISSGVHFTVAAGNSGAPVELGSPARVLEANTVGAVDGANAVASFSNFGPTLDVWALGVDVLSAWIDGPNSSKSLSGTSMAAARVAGILAAAISKYGNYSPAKLSDDLTKNAKPVVNGASPWTNLLAVEW